MKNIYIMRHGETLFNVQGRTQGWSDSPLTEKGIADAKLAGKFMRDFPVKFDHFYSSTQERACDTMELVFPDTHYNRLKGLKEMNFGKFEGHPQYLEVDNVQKATFFAQFGGETRVQVAERMLITLNTICRQADTQNIFCVSHGAAMWSLVRWYYHEQLPAHLQGLHNLDMIHFTFDNEQIIFQELIKTI
jgi:probable phosphoglycerate mutase